MQADKLVEFLKGYEVAVIGLNRFTDEVCAQLPDLKVVSLCSAGVDHIDPAILNKYDIKMWWARRHQQSVGIGAGGLLHGLHAAPAASLFIDAA